MMAVFPSGLKLMERMELIECRWCPLMCLALEVSTTKTESVCPVRARAWSLGCHEAERGTNPFNSMPITVSQFCLTSKIDTSDEMPPKATWLPLADEAIHCTHLDLSCLFTVVQDSVSKTERWKSSPPAYSHLPSEDQSIARMASSSRTLFSSVILGVPVELSSTEYTLSTPVALPTARRSPLGLNATRLTQFGNSTWNVISLSTNFPSSLDRI
mmetsp:Transcript_13821/g.38187  ORF Transcript_13821/g.38187 Transcript_13821/m.38187 type:complete len:214 (+) Transcript_13821:1070-1711(+)